MAARVNATARATVKAEISIFWVIFQPFRDILAIFVLDLSDP
jgi:hypothetical protein